MALAASTIFVALADSKGNLVEFYRTLFGLEPQIWIPEVYAEFWLPGLRLGIFTPKADHLTEFQAGSGGMSLCVEVKQLEVAIQQLTVLGYPPPGSPMMASHGREIYAYDPAGNRLILHERKDPVG
jgi:predicted enzyme related to lactoylglutathione lyase